jgi:hypothetical protein
LGRIQDDGTELEIGSGLNFIGLTVELNEATGFIDISHTEGGGSLTSDDVSNESGVAGATVTAALDALDAAISSGGVPGTRLVTAGAGLTGGGDLSADRTFDVAAADGTITVNANSIQVGTLTNANSPTNTLGLNKLVNAAAAGFVGATGAGAWGALTGTQAAALLAGPIGATTTVTTITATGLGTFVGVAVGGALSGVTTLAMTGALSGATSIGCTSLACAGPITTVTTLNGATVAAPVEGTALTDADQTLTVAGGNDYTQNTALTASRTKTLGTTGSPETGEVITIKRFTTAAFTMPIVNGGAGAGTLYTFPSAGKRVADFRYDGTNWVLAGVKRLA